MQPGTSAILVILRKVTPDKFEEALRPYGGTVLRTSLSREQEQELMKALHGGRPVGTDLGAVTGPGREPGYREPGLSRRPRPRRRFAAADLAAAQRIAETDSRTLDRVMPTVPRLANRGFLGVYVDLVHARQELEGLLGRRGLGRRLAEVVGLIQVLRRSRPHELILDGRRL